MRLLIVYLLVAAAVKAETPKPNLTLEKVVQTIEIRDADEVWIHHRSAAIVWNARGEIYRSWCFMKINSQRLIISKAV